MVDTIWLNTENFHREPISKWKQMVTSDCTTGEIISQKAICNEFNGITMEEIPQRGTGLPMLCVKFSAPKLICGTSLREVQESDLDQIIDRVGKAVKLSGVYVPAGIEKIRAGRLDYCKNIETENDISNYMEAMKTFDMARKEKSSHGIEEILWKNKTSQFTIYDKMEEVIAGAERKNNLELLAMARLEQIRRPNVARLESRLLNGRAIKQRFGLLHPANIVDLFTMARSKQVLLGDFDRLIGKNAQLDLHLDDLNASLEYARQHSEKRALSVWVRSQGLATILKRFNNDVQLIGAWLTKRGEKKEAIKPMLRLLRDELQRNIDLKDLKGTMTVSTLVDELRRKLAA